MKEKKIKNEQIFKNGLIFLVLVNNEKVQKIRSSVLKNQDPFPPFPSPLKLAQVQQQIWKYICGLVDRGLLN